MARSSSGMISHACVMVKSIDEPWCDDVAAGLKFFECVANHQRFATGEAGLEPAGDENDHDEVRSDGTDPEMPPLVSSDSESETDPEMPALIDSSE